MERIHVELNEFPDEEYVLFLENHDPAAFPRIEIDFSRHVYCLNLKYSQKLTEFKDQDDFAGIVRKMDEQFEKEIDQ